MLTKTLKEDTIFIPSTFFKAWQSQDLNTGSLTPEPLLLATSAF
jgi:hypothetical protein